MSESYIQKEEIEVTCGYRNCNKTFTTTYQHKAYCDDECKRHEKNARYHDGHVPKKKAAPRKVNPYFLVRGLDKAESFRTSNSCLEA